MFAHQQCADDVHDAVKTHTLTEKWTNLTQEKQSGIREKFPRKFICLFADLLFDMFAFMHFLFCFCFCASCTGEEVLFFVGLFVLLWVCNEHQVEKLCSNPSNRSEPAEEVRKKWVNLSYEFSSINIIWKSCLHT